MTTKTYGYLQTGIAEVLRQARGLAVRSVNAVMTASYWEVGRRIVEAEQKGQRRAAYGEQLIKQLAVDLTKEFGRGFGEMNLRQMRRFYLMWSVDQIQQTLSVESGFSGLKRLEAMSSASSGVASPVLVSGLFNLTDLARAFPLPWSAYGHFYKFIFAANCFVARYSKSSCTPTYIPVSACRAPRTSSANSEFLERPLCLSVIGGGCGCAGFLRRRGLAGWLECEAVKDGLHNLCEPRLRDLGPIRRRDAKDWLNARCSASQHPQ